MKYERSNPSGRLQTKNILLTSGLLTHDFLALATTMGIFSVNIPAKNLEMLDKKIFNSYFKRITFP